jgi:hypothetical protein
MAESVERWFADSPTKGSTAAHSAGVKELQSAICEFIAVHNENPNPFAWTRTADQILDSIARCPPHSHPTPLPINFTNQ